LRDDLLNLDDHLVQHVTRVADHQRAEAGAGDHHQFDRLPDLMESPAHHEEAAEDAAQNDKYADYLLHDDSLLCVMF
jgi:hypothetical protein